MRILGVDGSLSRTGLAVIDTDETGLTDRLLGTGTIRTRPEDGDDADRYATIARGVVAVAQRYRADLVALEMPFVDPSKSAQVALRLAGLRSVVEGALRRSGLEFVAVAPASRIKALGIKGRGLERAELKRQTVALVEARFNVSVTDDEADAYGVAKAGLAKWSKAQRKAVQLTLGIKPGRRAAQNRPSDL
jgi:Holliday junction resolvasome RuvABC endonuclease subunit